MKRILFLVLQLSILLLPALLGYKWPPMCLWPIYYIAALILLAFLYDVFLAANGKKREFEYGSDSSIDRNDAVEVAQGEYAVWRDDERNIKYLATGHTTACTLFHGYDSINKTAFICHVDVPFFASDAIERLVSDIKMIQSRDHLAPNLRFKAELTGGLFNSVNSQTTRILISRAVSSIPKEECLQIEIVRKTCFVPPFKLRWALKFLSLKSRTLSIKLSDGSLGKYHKDAPKGDCGGNRFCKGFSRAPMYHQMLMDN